VRQRDFVRIDLIASTWFSRESQVFFRAAQNSGILGSPMFAGQSATLWQNATEASELSHHHVNVVADGVPAEGRQMLLVRDVVRYLAGGG
jgi:CRISPR/Cas system endoribonuclease Cas6 (RAMP superfamily)